MFLILFFVLFLSPANAQEKLTFSQAREISQNTGKPLLLDFYHDDCESCKMAAEEMDTSAVVKKALEKAVYLSLSVLETEGGQLADEYKVGNNYPVFILLNTAGDIVRRWTGYSSVGHFAAMLKQALADLSTVDDRLKRFKKNPTFADAATLAKYYSDSKEYLKALEFYAQAEKLGGSSIDYSYEIFSNTAGAFWDDMIESDRLFAAADRAVKSKKDIANVVRVGLIMANIFRNKNISGDLAEYLQAGIEATSGSRNDKFREYNALLRADYALHIENDFAKAVQIKKASMGAGWESDRDKSFAFARWCLDRKINLEEAEDYARRTVNQVLPGKRRAIVLNTLAEIYYYQGESDKAVKIIKMAIEQDPEKEFYKEQLEKFLE